MLVIPFADLPESRHRLSFIFGLEADPFSVDLAVPILATLEWIAKTGLIEIKGAQRDTPLSTRGFSRLYASLFAVSTHGHDRYADFARCHSQRDTKALCGHEKPPPRKVGVFRLSVKSFVGRI